MMHPKNVTIEVIKTSSESSGLFLYKDEKNRIIISSILAGLFSNTELKTNMEIVSVNDICCEGMTDSFVTSLIDETNGQVKLVVREVIYEAFVQHGGFGNENDVVVAPQPSAPTMISSAVTVDNYPPQPMIASAAIINPPQTQQMNHQQHNPTRNPPNGCSPGGTYRQIRVAGDQTKLLCCVLACCFGVFSLCGFCAFSCPQDEMEVYQVNGKVHNNE
jgi:hypothetical protein